MQRAYANSFLLILFAFLAFAPAESFSWGGLKGKIQSELDGNPFLRNEEIKIKVVSEDNGYVTLKMYEGSRTVREEINKGFDIFSSQFEQKRIWEGVTVKETKTVKALRRTLTYIKEMKGVKQIMLVSEINTPLDHAEDLYEEAVELYKKKKYAKAALKMRKPAELGLAKAEYSLALMYRLGRGMQKDCRQATNWYERAANRGFAIAQNDLGAIYGRGECGRKNYKKMLYWYRKAADQGFAMAQSNIGFCYANGQGVDKDLAKAATWFRKAADQGHLKSQYALGCMYSRGDDVPKDYEQSIYWLKKAADQGYAPAQNNLAWLLATCDDPRCRDGGKAVYYARKAYDKKPKDASFAGTFAAAYARDGQFKRAVKHARKSISLLEGDRTLSASKKKELIRDARERLNLYKRGKAYPP